MAVFGRREAETQYGIRVRWANGDTSDHWFANETTRDRKHNDYVKKAQVLVVQNISRRK